MAINYQAIAGKLRHARELQSLSIDTVSLATGIPFDRISLIESGRSKPSGDEVLILANFYNHDFRDFIDDNRPAPFEQTDLLYRRHGDDFHQEDRRAIQEFLFLCEIESALEDELVVSKIKFNFKPKGSYYKGHGESAARELRKFLGYAPNEIPRDVFKDFRRIGCHVFRRRLTNSNISGIYIEHPIAGHCILVNYDEDVYRQRFSVSHEAAHAIFDSSETIVVSYRQNSRYTANDLREKRANRFASCYLMPPDNLPRVHKWTAELAIKWAQDLRVSTTALSIALHEMDLIDESTGQMIRSVKVPKTEKIDPEAPTTLNNIQRERRMALLERGLSSYYVGLCFDAHYNGLITAGRLCEVLLADHAETREISLLFGRPINHGS